MRQTRSTEIETIARIVPAPTIANRGARVFDLHPAVHLMLVGCYAAFVGILLTAFMGPDLIVSAAIVILSVIALFGTPALWARVAPEDEAPKQSWAEFRTEGMDCYTGHVTAGEALAQILVLPCLLVALGAAIAIINISL
jgi:hypothetical protein